MMLGPAAAARVAELEAPARHGVYLGLYNATWSATFAIGPWLGTLSLERFVGPIHWALEGALGVIAAGLFALRPRGAGRCRRRAHDREVVSGAIGALVEHVASRHTQGTSPRDDSYLENWAVERYGAPGAFISAGDTHIYPQSWDPPDAWGNPTEYENQHAFGDILQGIFVRLDDHAPFDLISIDYRTREDADPEHVSAVPGADPANVAIWIADVLTVPTTAWRSYPTGKAANVAMSHWSTLFPAGLTDVTGVFITTTGNVSIDNVVVRPR